MLKKRAYFFKFLRVCSGVFLICGSLKAGAQSVESKKPKLPSANQIEKDPLNDKWDGEWITISGRVVDVSNSQFTIQAKGKKTIVEMDDYGWAADGYKLSLGDDVIVSGQVDQKLFSKNTIKAASVYVKGLNSYFFSKSEKNDHVPQVTTVFFGLATLPEGASTELRGRVGAVTGRKFILKTGLRQLTVDTSLMPFNPLDDKGSLQIEKGDLVQVTGVVDDQFFGGKEVKASSIAEVR